MSNDMGGELKNLLNILKQCVSSCHQDLNVLQQSAGQELSERIIASLIFKISKLSECAKTVQKLLKRMKKDEVKCFSCIKGSVSDQHSRDPDTSQ